ncbi:hypothetical protein BTCD_0248 [Brochothrix thermosphacta]|uniref:Uncharacterized protein n=1 Tax=Brochothrix thermosphacta TaxID=2756 RepID=A0A2X0R7M9_BROTH|nr:hypothetical protein BTCD_0248 [Brochothrix thermosphacta]SPP30220.1 hypothetical protein BTBSAS_70071 [Brochothrix thermosphacta]SPP30598.1 hypothetical protein BTTAP_90054 [Brochothrix thermosphacta]
MAFFHSVNHGIVKMLEARNYNDEKVG